MSASDPGNTPGLRIERLIRSILETRWDSKTWPTAKATLKQALEERITPETAEQEFVSSTLLAFPN